MKKSEGLVGLGILEHFLEHPPNNSLEAEPLQQLKYT